VLVGDDRQLQPIEAGGPFAALVKRLGAARLSNIQRQHEDWMREAVRQFADGDARGALTQYALAERLHVAASRRGAMHELVASWSLRKTCDLSQTLILAGLRDETDDLNRLAQAERLRRGELSEREGIHLPGNSFYIGDRVVFTKNDYALRVLNGSFATVEGVHERRLRSPELLVRLDDMEGGTPRRILLQVTTDTPLQLGYAVTTHKAQGATVDRAFVLTGGVLADRELAYVQVSRAREETRLFLSEDDAGEDLAVLARTLERSHKKLLAHDVEQAPTLALNP
jgi:ATP-dependent exoDNAse (exonuclease V) alpha subunit